jgi:hypothetical protein
MLIGPKIYFKAPVKEQIPVKSTGQVPQQASKCGISFIDLDACFAMTRLTVSCKKKSTE